MILLLAAMVRDIHHHKSPKNNRDLDGVQGHSRDPKASDAGGSDQGQAAGTVTKAKPPARCCWAWAVRSRRRQSRWKHTARASALRLSPLFSSAVACRPSEGGSSH